MIHRTTVGSRRSEEDRLLEEASRWFLVLRAAEPTADMRAQFSAWCGQHPLHESSYRKVVATWEAVGANAAADELVVARREAVERARPAARRPSADSSDRRWWVGRAGSLAAIAAGLVLIVAVRLWPPREPVQSYVTVVGERRSLSLSDKSRVTLDSESRIAVRYSDTDRSVELIAGQAYFDVASDPIRPFEVKVADETVVAHGTEFNIERRDEEVSVTLIAGRVTVTGAQVAAANRPDGHGTLPTQTTSYELVPGEQLNIGKNGEVHSRRNVSVEHVTAWQLGKIVMQDQPLSDACARMNRYSRVKIVVQDEAAARLSVSGVFGAGDTAAFAEALESLFALRAVRVGSDSILLVSAE